ncbi:hypothetical protein VNI00_001782 [Paramarasmius palmivorus]|uniref:MYND-type domain-containing protein n=1 Tax=Paramarasmius palmivorus TaxID=297713 RepID=A0AAW0E1T5_9AGAR
MSSSETPPFLQPLGFQNSQNSFVQAIFPHEYPLGPAHVLWSSSDLPKFIVLFIPGNPGLLDFYLLFLSELKSRVKDLAILAHSYINHTPELTTVTAEHGLTAQVQAAVEAFDAIKQNYSSAKVILIGHSIGTWVSLEVLKARPNDVYAVHLICPTISHIAKTPNGRRLSWLFQRPLPLFISKLSYLLRPLPAVVISTLFRAWPENQVTVLRRLLRSPTSIFACLSMAHDEMQMIRDLDVALLEQHKHKICIYFAETDDWVGEQRGVVLRSFKADPGSIRIVHGKSGVPHAFCITAMERAGHAANQHNKNFSPNDAIKSLRNLGKPPPNPDIEQPGPRIKSALDIIGDMAFDLVFVCRQDTTHPTLVSIRKNWLTGIAPWVELFLAKFAVADPSTAPGLEFRDAVFHTMPAILTLVAGPRNTSEEILKLRSKSPLLFPLFYKAWVKVLSITHVSWPSWASVVSEMVFIRGGGDDGVLMAEEFVKTMREMHQSGKENIAALCIRHINLLVQAAHSRQLADRDYKGFENAMKTFVSLFHTSTSMSQPFIVNGGITTIVKLLATFVATRTLRRHTEGSEEFSSAIGVFDLALALLQSLLKSQVSASEALDAGVLKAIFKAKRFFLYDSHPASTHRIKSTSSLISLVVKQLDLFLVFPSVLRRFYRVSISLSESGIEDELGWLQPRPQAFLATWEKTKRKAKELRTIFHDFEMACPSMCAHIQCPFRDSVPPPGTRYLRCSSCMNVMYCSHKCGKAGWASHKILCGLFGKALREGRPGPCWQDIHFFREITNQLVIRNYEEVVRKMEMHPSSKQGQTLIVLVNLDDPDQPEFTSPNLLAVVDFKQFCRDSRMKEHDDAIPDVKQYIGRPLRERAVLAVGVFPVSKGGKSRVWPIVDIVHVPEEDDYTEDEYTDEEDDGSEEDYTDEDEDEEGEDSEQWESGEDDGSQKGEHIKEVAS